LVPGTVKLLHQQPTPPICIGTWAAPWSTPLCVLAASLLRWTSKAASQQHRRWRRSWQQLLKRGCKNLSWLRKFLPVARSWCRCVILFKVRLAGSVSIMRAYFCVCVCMCVCLCVRVQLPCTTRMGVYHTTLTVRTVFVCVCVCACVCACAAALRSTYGRVPHHAYSAHCVCVCMCVCLCVRVQLPCAARMGVYHTTLTVRKAPWTPDLCSIAGTKRYLAILRTRQSDTNGKNKQCS